MRNNLQWHSATVRAHRDLSAERARVRDPPRAWRATVERGQPPAAARAGRRPRRDPQLFAGRPADERRGADEVYRIAVRRAEPGRGGSRWLWQRETGDELLIGEPNNHFEIGRSGARTRCWSLAASASRRSSAWRCSWRARRELAPAVCRAPRRRADLPGRLACGAGRAAAHLCSERRRAPRPGRRDRRAASGRPAGAVRPAAR